jgi:hypothetical protein
VYKFIRIVKKGSAMNKPFESLQDLFKQLGLPAGYAEIQSFLQSHSPLDESILLADATWWAPDQRDFLRDELIKDADWAEAIDLLNSQLRLKA